MTEEPRPAIDGVAAPRSGAVVRSLPATVVKLAVAAGVLWFVLRGVNGPELRQLLIGASKPLILLGILLNIATVFIAGLRWKLLVRAAGVPLRWRDLTCIAFIGQFFATFLPGPVGDDLTRMVYVARIAGDKTPLALSSVVIDRLIGLSVILLLAVIVVPWHYSLLAGDPQTAFLAGGLVAGGLAVALGLGLFFLLPHRWLHRAGGVAMQLAPAGRWRVLAGRFVGAYVDHRRTIGLVLAAAFAVQVVLCAVFWVAGLAVGVSAGPAVWFGFVPVVLAANALPITIAGLGIREYLVVLFLGVLAQVPPELALAASLAVFLMMLATNLLGGLVFLAYRARGAGVRAGSA